MYVKDMLLIVFCLLPKKESAYKELQKLSIFKTKTGAKKLSICRCKDCDILFWGKRLFQQMGLSLYCRKCYTERSGKELPIYVRDLTLYEKLLIQNFYKESGVTLSYA